MLSSILGVGTAVPPERMSQADALQMTSDLVCENERQARFLKVLFRGAGVEHRNTVIPWQTGYTWKEFNGQRSERGPSTAARMQLYQQHAPPLAHAAAESALQDAGIGADQVTHVVTVSCTGFSSPGVDLSLFQSLGLSRIVQRLHIGYMGCHGAINGLRAAQGLTAADPSAVVLLCAVELCSLHYRLHWDPEGIKGNALFADGAAAVVLGHQEAEQPTWNLRGTGSCFLPESDDEMSWTIGDHGFEMRLTGQVPVVIENHLKAWLSAWLDRYGYALDDIGGWGVHPGGPRILDAAEAALGLPKRGCPVSREILRNYGNMSSPTVLFVFDRLRETTQGPIVLLAFGPGLAAEAALLEPADPPS